jgi:membrane-associated phospholipid phosphatase
MGQRLSNGAKTGIQRHITKLDSITMGYIVAFIFGVLIFGRSQSTWLQTVLTNCAILAAIVGMIWRWGDHKQGVTGLFRNLYPAMLYPIFYAQMQGAVHWVMPGFLDSQLVAFEQSIFGAAPNIWLTQIQSPMLNEWMMLGYFTYYLLIPFVALLLHFKGRDGDSRRMLTATTIAFVISYIGFVIYPIEGPRYFLTDQFAGPLEGWVFVPLVNWIIAGGAIHGGCMPSSHTAVALVLLVWARRTSHKLSVWMAPFVFTLFVATVWGRFHYVTDVLVGWLVGAVGLYVADWLDSPETIVAKADSSLNRTGNTAPINQVA